MKVESKETSYKKKRPLSWRIAFACGVALAIIFMIYGLGIFSRLIVWLFLAGYDLIKI